MTDHVRTVDMSDPTVVLDCYRKLNVAYKELKAENERLQKYYAELTETNAKLLVLERKRAEKLRAALKQIAETYNKPTTSKDGLAFMAAEALKETDNGAV